METTKECTALDKKQCEGEKREARERATVMKTVAR
jgi:hypothetical protein